MANVFFNKDAFLEPLKDKVIHRWCVALSGGVDSVVLLHFLRDMFDTVVPTAFQDATRSIGADPCVRPIPIIAIHVNHHLQPQANAWQNFCEDLCRRWNIPLQVVDVQLSKEGNVEANARRLRYKAIFSRLMPNDVLLTAHHEDDQAETVLLQLLRGAGPKGLAAMPRQMEMENSITHYRPLLSVTRAEIASYAKTHQLQHIDDLSNEDIAYDRNYLRQLVIPLLRQRWPSYARTLARSASLSAELVQWVQPLWQAMLEQCRCVEGNILDLNKLADLSNYECSEVLRLWLEEQNTTLPTEAQMQQIINIIRLRRGKVALHNVVLAPYQNHLYALSPGEMLAYQGVFPWTNDKNELCINNIVLHRETVLGQGLAIDLMADCEVRFRAQGERFHATGRVGSHPLKKLFQEWGIPPWQRGRIPLIYVQDELVAVVGYAYQAGKLAKKDEKGVIFSYLNRF